ncbi:MAG: DUF736 domain-containing protein [Hyphomicrobiaceae bacterium]|nr:DUF736 domain-containing protein [Hyphomicrobiaceae bacterium]
MAIIGTFTPMKDGYAGTIRTLSVNAKVHLIAVDGKSSEGAPDYRLLAGGFEIGAAWRHTRKGTDETYLRVKLDDPTLPQPIWAALLESSDDGIARLVWRRDKRGEA